VRAYGGVFIGGRWSRGYSTTMSLIHVMMEESPWIITTFRSMVEKNSACAALIEHVLLLMEACKWRWRRRTPLGHIRGVGRPPYGRWGLPPSSRSMAHLS